MMRRPSRTSQRTFHDEAFIWISCYHQTVGVGSHCVAPWSRALSWSYRIFTPICMESTFLYLISSLAFKVHIVVTPEIVSEILHVPRVAHPDYPGCERLRTVSKDELSSLFCETPFSWGDHQNTPCSGFAKGSRFLHMVMTFILHPLSHYNTITESRVWFLLSLLKDISINFPFHFILYLILPLAITRILCHFSIFFPTSPHFSVMGGIDRAIVRQSEA